MAMICSCSASTMDLELAESSAAIPGMTGEKSPFAGASVLL